MKREVKAGAFRKVAKPKANMPMKYDPTTKANMEICKSKRKK